MSRAVRPSPERIVPKQVRTRARRLEALNRAYSDDPAFSHLRYLTPMRAGHGNIEPRIAFLVESPQHQPDSMNDLQYLHGPERIVVKDLLRSIDLPEENIYYTGLVKYPTPGNRPTRADEVTASMPYLRSELAIINPFVVIVFGRHLVELILPGVQLVHHHGMLCEARRFYVPMFHPVAALYNADIRKAMFRDFARLNVIL